MFDIIDSTKRGARIFWSAIRKYALPTYITSGRVVSSASSTIPVTVGLADKLHQVISKETGPAPSSLALPLIFANVAVNAINNTVIRGPANFDHYGEADSDVFFDAPEAPDDIDDHLPPEDYHQEAENLGYFSDWTLPEFGKLENGILISVRIMLYLSIVSMFVGSISNTMRLYELFLQLLTVSADLSGGLLVLEIIVTLLFSVANAGATLSYNVPASLGNTIHLIKEIKKGNIKATPELIATALVGTISLTAIVFGTFYGSSKQYINLFIERLKASSTSIIKLAAILTTAVGFVGDATSKVVSFYRLIFKIINEAKMKFSSEAALSQPIEEIKLPLYWKILKPITFFVSIIDAIFSGSANLVSIPFTLKELFGADPDNTGITTFSIATGVSTAAMTLAFSVDGIYQTEKRVLKRQAKNERDELHAIERRIAEQQVKLAEQSETEDVFLDIDEHEDVKLLSIPVGQSFKVTLQPTAAVQQIQQGIEESDSDSSESISDEYTRKTKAHGIRI